MCGKGSMSLSEIYIKGSISIAEIQGHLKLTLIRVLWKNSYFFAQRESKSATKTSKKIPSSFSGIWWCVIRVRSFNLTYLRNLLKICILFPVNGLLQKSINKDFLRRMGSSINCIRRFSSCWAGLSRFLIRKRMACITR